MKLWTPSRELHLPTPDMIGFFLEVGAWDKAGKLYHQERLRSRSPVRQLLSIILAGIGEANVASVTDTAGASKTIDYDGTAHLNALGPINTSARGIVIGTDATAVDMTDTKLVAQIAHGTGSGQMIHNLQVCASAITVADPDATFETYRNFNNNSGATITVRETGIYVNNSVTGTPATGYFCIVRDVPTAVAVPDGGGCYVLYTLKITE